MIFDRKYLHAPWQWLLRALLGKMVLLANWGVPWPVHPCTTLHNPENIEFCPEDLANFQSPGCYWQASAKIRIGRGTRIGPNVGLITKNRNPEDPKTYREAAPIIIGENCWIGMNCVILPGVVLGDYTTVGAGSVVTRSFPNGHCVIAGCPAKLLNVIP